MNVPTYPTLVRTIPISNDPIFRRVAPVIVRKPSGKPVRQRALRTHCRQGHALTEYNIYTTGDKRRCKTCHLNRCNESKQRKSWH